MSQVHKKQLFFAIHEQEPVYTHPSTHCTHVCVCDYVYVNECTLSRLRISMMVMIKKGLYTFLPLDLCTVLQCRAAIMIKIGSLLHKIQGILKVV